MVALSSLTVSSTTLPSLEEMRELYTSLIKREQDCTDSNFLASREFLDGSKAIVLKKNSPELSKIATTAAEELERLPLGGIEADISAKSYTHDFMFNELSVRYARLSNVIDRSEREMFFDNSDNAIILSIEGSEISIKEHKIECIDMGVFQLSDTYKEYFSSINEYFLSKFPPRNPLFSYKCDISVFYKKANELIRNIEDENLKILQICQENTLSLDVSQIVLDYVLTMRYVEEDPIEIENDIA